MLIEIEHNESDRSAFVNVKSIEDIDDDEVLLKVYDNSTFIFIEHVKSFTVIM